ncbi:hypothetical protein [Glaciecola sp. 1036]|uniref:hypothetical protein n=1 Tax=Alteromonadaceae TaxID=72275 RepID=UPI003CFEA0A6
MDLEKWEQTRAKGKTRFVIMKGVIGWGVTTAILWSIIMAFVAPTDNLWLRPLLALVLFPLGGIAFGHFAWQSAEKKYAKSKAK